MEERIPIWIDTDTGTDDAVMLLCATALNVLDIKGVSAVCGNAEEQYTFKNARDVLSLCNREDIKVYPGAEKPLLKPLMTGEGIHGKEGLGNARIPASKAPKETEYGYDAMYCTAKECGSLTVVATGPLTNIALAITKYPDIGNYIREIVWMGGAVVGGNVTPSAEFNCYVDPHAAAIVFKCGIPVKMFGLDVTLKATLHPEEAHEIASMNTPKTDLFRDALVHEMVYAKEVQKTGELSIHDVSPVMYLAYPSMYHLEKAGVFVETQSEITLGKTVCDYYSDFKFEDRHCMVALDVDRDAYAKTLKALLVK